MLLLTVTFEMPVATGHRHAFYDEFASSYSFVPRDCSRDKEKESWPRKNIMWL